MWHRASSVAAAVHAGQVGCPRPLELPSAVGPQVSTEKPSKLAITCCSRVRRVQLVLPNSPTRTSPLSHARESQPMSSSASPARPSQGLGKACAGKCVCVSSYACDRLGLGAHGVGLQSIGDIRYPHTPTLQRLVRARHYGAPFCTRWRTLRDVQIHPASLRGRAAMCGVDWRFPLLLVLGRRGHPIEIYWGDATIPGRPATSRRLVSQSPRPAG